MFKEVVSLTEDVINPNSSIWVELDTVPAGVDPPDPKPLLTADAEINVSDINDAVKANDALSTNPSILDPLTYDAVADAVMNPNSSIWLIIKLVSFSFF